MLDLKNFTSKSDDINDKELELYKKKLEQIYDLCKQCKLKVNNHLQKQDQLIGNCLLKQRKTKNSNNAMLINNNLHGQQETKKTSNGNLEYSSTNGLSSGALNGPTVRQNKLDKENVEDRISKLPVSENLSASFKKAYTIAGSMPSFLRKFSKSDDYSYTEEMSKNKYNSESKKILIPNDDLNSSGNVNVDPKAGTTTTQSKNTFTIILGDFAVLIVALIVFFSDLVNLINDSDFVNDNIDKQSVTKNDFALFQFLLNCYRYNMVVLFFVLLLTIHLSYKRPKISRFLTVLSILVNWIIHLRVCEMKMEEQYIIEVFFSFFLALYILFARMYNFFQFFQFMGIL
jgi:hypothetical protein